MSSEQFKALVPWPADMPLDVGSMSLAAHNGTNLLKYLQPPLFNWTWASNNTPPAFAYDSTYTGHGNLQLITPPVAGYRSNPYNSLQGRLWYSKDTTLDIQFRVHIIKGHKWPQEISEGERIGVQLKVGSTGSWTAIPLTQVFQLVGLDEHEPITWWATAERLSTAVNQTFTLKGLGLFWVAS